MDAKTRQINFMYMLERINQPLFMGTRGQGESQVLYNIPPDILEKYEAKVMVDLRNKIPPETNVNVITVSKTITPYDLSPVLEVPKRDFFSYFSPNHRDAADALTKIFLDQPNEMEFFNACATCRDAVNPHLWVHSFLSATLQRKDMQGFVIPNMWEIIPDHFIEAKFLNEAQRQASFPSEDQAVVEVPLDFTGFDTDAEHKVAYFREDVAFNSYHWHWHIANPFRAAKGTIDRKGELFCLIHHDMLARFNSERLSNGLNRLLPYTLKDNEVIAEAYFPKMTLQNSGRSWGGRQANTMPSDMDHMKDPVLTRRVYLDDIRIASDRIMEAIDAGFAISSDGKKVDINNTKGIDIIGAMIESSKDSINPVYYGDLHNMAHNLFTYTHDPFYRYKEGPCVMLNTMTAGRDPVFWTFHYYLELMYRRHKEYLPSYSTSDLLVEGISITNIEVQTPSLDINSLLTYWMKSDVDLSRGLDFFRTDINKLGPIWARLTHLQHRDFEYHITVKNTRKSNLTGFVRIFMAPKLDEQGDQLPFSEQRNLFFQMDQFTTELRPGENLIRRSSVDSSLTIPWGQTFHKLERDVVSPTGVEAFCGCGFPQHLLIPKGRQQGIPFDLYVMISDWEDDKVIDPANTGLSDTQKVGCIDAVNFCGVMNRKYPVSRPMGFPLDRLPGNDITSQPLSTVADFVKPFPNMNFTEVNIFHRDVTVVREGGASPDARIVSV